VYPADGVRGGSSGGESGAHRLGVFFAYVAVALVVSFPLIAGFTTHFPGRRDEQDVFLFLWNNWWVSHAVTALHAKPYL
jgi:hypothetical protein